MPSLMDIRTVLWTNSFWFPDNLTWDVLQNKDYGPHKDIYYPQLNDLLVPFPIALGLLLLRYVMYKLVFRPIGKLYNLKEGNTLSPENIPSLHKHYKKVTKRPQYKEIEKLADELKWPTRNVERWFRKRRNQDKSSVMKKFCESCWRWTFYLTINLVGIYILYDEPLVYNVDLAWDGWPHHHVTSEYYVYYMVELGFYWSLLFTIWYDVKRSDYIEHVVHHIITISLMCFSWISNLVRIGILVLGLHDMVDHWLEGAKISKYLKFEKTCDVLFGTFTLVWLYTRIYIFPTTIVYKCWTKFTSSSWPAYKVYLIFLTALQVMHCVWTGPLLKGAYRAIRKRTTEDIRSASELSSLSADENGVTSNGTHKKDT